MTRTPATIDQLTAARQAGAIVPPTSWDLTIAPAGGKVIASWYDARGRKQSAYSADAVEARNAKKFSANAEFGAKLLNIRAAVTLDLTSSDARTRACAAIVMIMDMTTMRVGGAEYAETNATYGASSLLKSHVAVDGDAISFDFTGKHHKAHSKTIVSSALAAVITEFAATTEGEDLFPVTETAVRGYLSAFGATPKQFRTFHAGRIASETLTAMGAPTTAKEAAKNIAEAMKIVASILGNTPAMAKSSYVNPAILADYAAQCGN